MKVARLLKWSGTVQSPRTRPAAALVVRYQSSQRHQSTTTESLEPQLVSFQQDSNRRTVTSPIRKSRGNGIVSSRKSAKLSALHARLSLPSDLPLQTLARTLIDQTANPRPRFNNHALSTLGGDLLAYYTSEYILSKYPRLPTPVVYAAMWAYVGPKALIKITQEWGVEFAADPGSEVDPGLLQFKRLPFEEEPDESRPQQIASYDEHGTHRWSSRGVYDDEFGERITSTSTQNKGITAQKATTNFARALVGAIHLHGGRAAAKQFYKDHFMSRQLDMANLFSFRMPTRDLSRLCSREGFQPPIARLMSETGRKSRHPVFIVGIYSGNDKLGEGAGASLNEARTRAAISALKGWYLYSPLELRLPSDVEEDVNDQTAWKPALVDGGEIIN